MRTFTVRFFFVARRCSKAAFAMASPIGIFDERRCSDGIFAGRRNDFRDDFAERNDERRCIVEEPDLISREL